jgi:hypothetical protein
MAADKWDAGNSGNAVAGVADTDSGNVGNEVSAVAAICEEEKS